MGRPKGSRNRKQAISFPTEPLPSNAELDAAIDGAAAETSVFAEPVTSAEVEQIKKSSQRKKEISAAVKEIPQIFTPEQVVWVFSAYVMLLSFAYSVVLKTEYEKIHSELDIDEQSKMEMAKPLAKIASKYAPSEWAGMTDEIQLVAQIGIYTATSFGRAKLVAQREKEAKEKVTEQRKNQRTHAPNWQTNSVETVAARV